jgi:chemotaxis protein methyltransferase CheR
VRVVPELRATVSFRRVNFMEDDFGMNEKMDIIFCRNVIIYFDRPTQEKMLGRLTSHLLPGGFLFMGHSETLSGLQVAVKPVAPTIYRMPTK